METSSSATHCMCMRNKRGSSCWKRQSLFAGNVMAAWIFASCATRADAFVFPTSKVTKSVPTWGKAHHQATSPISKVSNLDLSLSSSSGDVNFARRVAEMVHPSVALVTPAGVRNMTARGSGFVVEPYENKHSADDFSTALFLLTAAHVAIPGYGLTVSFPGHKTDTTFSATVVARDVASDLALIRVDNAGEDLMDSLEPLELYREDEEIPVGTLAFANGYPGGITGSQPAMTMGIVCGEAQGFGQQDFFWGNNRDNRNSSTIEKAHANTTFVVTDAAMAGGMSGGPLVDAQGYVLGMNALVRPDMRALGNYAVSSTTCKTFLDSIEDKENAGTSSRSIGGYRVVLYNDPMNKRERVARILQDVAKLNETMANTVMMSAHTTGRGIIKEFPVKNRTEADDFCSSVRKEDVLVEVEAIMSG